MSIDLLLAGGAATDSFRTSRQQRKDEEAKQWYRDYQEKIRQLDEELKRSQEGRTQGRYDYEKDNLWDTERKLADLQAQGLDLDVGLKRDLNPYKVKEAEWQDKTNQYNYENVLPAQLEKLLIGNESDRFNLDFMLPEQLQSKKLDNQLSGKQLEWYDPRQRAEIANMYSLMDARQGEAQAPTGPFVPKNAQEQKEVYLNLRKMMDRADTMEVFLNGLTEYGPVIQTLIGPEQYQALLNEVYDRTGGKPEQYFGRNPIPGDLVGSYLQNLGVIDQLRNIKPKPKDGRSWFKRIQDSIF